MLYTPRGVSMFHVNFSHEKLEVVHGQSKYTVGNALTVTFKSINKTSVCEH